MDIYARLDRIEDLIVSSKHMPFSSSVMVNEAEVFELLDELRAALPDDLKQARWLVKEKQDMLDGAQTEAERIREEARQEREALISETEVMSSARAEAKRLTDEATQRAKEIRLEAEDYADERLANLEVTCYKLLEVIKRARERLQGQVEETPAPQDLESL
ncbi:MAG: ATPase [Candidatus Geothermincolia bacterium]